MRPRVRLNNATLRASGDESIGDESIESIESIGAIESIEMRNYTAIVVNVPGQDVQVGDDVEKESHTQEPDAIVGGDRDEHSCVTSAGFSWCDELERCIHPCRPQSFIDSRR